MNAKTLSKPLQLPHIPTASAGEMLASRLFTLVGASIFRHHPSTANLLWPICPIPYIKPLRFPTPQSHRCRSSAAVLEAHSVNAVTASHPWPEWVVFVDKLKAKGYLNQSATTEAEVAESGGGDGVVYMDMNLLKEACLNFARDRFDIFKSLSRQEVQTVVDKGCPNLFRKAVNSAKRLREYLQLDEGDVCSGCLLRGSCDRAYVILKGSEASARTVDIVRILLLYALDPLVTSGGAKSSDREVIEVSARKLLSELVELSETSRDPDLPEPAVKVSQPRKQSIRFVSDEDSREVEMKRGDWMCPQCNFMNFAKNVKCRRCREDGPKGVHQDRQDGVEMKKGDWICSECNFMNFARNVRCLQCKAEGPKRVFTNNVEMKKGDWNCPQCGFMNFASKINCLRCQDPRPMKYPGDWKCPKCDFLNFSSNVVCKKCNCKCPKKAEYEEWTKPE